MSGYVIAADSAPEARITKNDDVRKTVVMFTEAWSRRTSAVETPEMVHRLFGTHSLATYTREFFKDEFLEVSVRKMLDQLLCAWCL